MYPTGEELLRRLVERHRNALRRGFADEAEELMVEIQRRLKFDPRVRDIRDEVSALLSANQGC